MQDLRWMLKEILDCGLMEVDMLRKTDIDISQTVQYITEEGLPLNMKTIFFEAFYEKVMCELYDDNEIRENDFEIYYNGALDTHIYIKNGKYDYYKENFPEQIEAIETYMNMKFEEAR